MQRNASEVSRNVTAEAGGAGHSSPEPLRRHSIHFAKAVHNHNSERGCGEGSGGQSIPHDHRTIQPREGCER
jgi:hypothetical protein